MKNNKGVTLIALIITIIVLLILAGIGIRMVVGENGILSRAQEAKTTTVEKAAREKVDLSVSGAITRSNYGELTIENLKEEVGKYGGTMIGDEFPVTVTMDGYEFEVNNKGNVAKNREKISKTESYVGYYADMDEDGTVDGVIYADLAIGGNGKWFTGDSNDSWLKAYGEYTIPKTNNINDLKDYYISQADYNGMFGNNPVISPTFQTGGGTERFYVMALTDIGDNTQYTWYKTANGNMKDYDETTAEEFGTGKNNTKNIMDIWSNSKYGEQDNEDMWGAIQEEVRKGWYVPSREEWAAFADALKIDMTNFEEKGLNYWYWSSSQNSISAIYGMHFNSGSVGYTGVNSNYYVRLGATF